MNLATLLTATGGAAALLTLAACGAGEPAADTGVPMPVAELVELESPAAPGSGEPNLYAAADGRVYLSWLEATDDGDHALRFAAMTEDGGGAAGWSEPRTIARSDDFFVNWADFPSVVVLPDGSLAAHWLVRSGEGTYAYDVHVARSTDGGATWSEDIIPHRDGTESEHGFVSLFPWLDGRLAAVWLDGRKLATGTEEMTLRHTTIGPGGTLGDEVLLDPLTCDCCQTGAALTDRGPVVVYRDRTPDEVRDIYITRYVDGSWTEPRPVHEDGWVMPACPVNGPAVSADGSRVAVAWFTAADDTPRVRIAFSDDAGARFGPPLRVDEGMPVGRVDVGLLPDGAALVTWLEETDDGSAVVRIRRVEADGPTGPAMTVARSTGARSSGFPRMVRAGRRLVFAWTEPGPEPRVRVATAQWVGR